MAKPRTPRSNSKKNDNNNFNPAAASTLAVEIKKNIVPINLEEEIRSRAYELFEQRAGSPGSDQEDWLRAESEVLGRYQQTA
jgi:hypothetical protein